MALNNAFYNNIYEKEQYWNFLSKQKLLNIYYIIGNEGIRDFYIKSRSILYKEYSLTKNIMLENYIEAIDSILKIITKMESEYRKGNNISIKELTNSFLVNQMNNDILENTIDLKGITPEIEIYSNEGFSKKSKQKAA